MKQNKKLFYLNNVTVSVSEFYAVKTSVSVPINKLNIGSIIATKLLLQYLSFNNIATIVLQDHNNFLLLYY